MDNSDTDSQQLRDELTTETDLIESVKFDSVLRSVGFSFLYQGVQLLMILSFWFTFAFTVLDYVVTGYEPPHVCAETNETELFSKYSLSNDTTAKIVYDMCQIRITSNITGHPEDVASTRCVNGHSYEGGKDATMKTEWDLVCERNGIGELVQTMLGVGMVIGSVIMSSVPDRYGRKRTVSVLCVITAVIEIGISFSPSIYVVIALKLLSGIVIQDVGSAAYVLGMELVVTKHRERFVFATSIYWTVCMIFLGGVSYALSAYSWRVLQLVITLCGAMPLLFVYFIDESLPWLFAKSRHSQALKIIKKGCVKNGSNFDVAKQKYDECVTRLDKIQERNNARKSTVAKYGLLDILFNRRLLITSLIFGFSFFTHGMAFMGLYLTSATFKVNHYLIIIIMALLDIPSTIVYFVVLRYTKTRRSSIMVFLPTAVVCLLVSACLVSVGSSASDHVSNASMAFFLLGKFSLSISDLSACSFVVEHYPTTARHIGLAICNFVGRIGYVFSPFLYPLYLIVSWVPSVILSVLCFVTAGLYLMVPETKNRELPSTIIEAVDALPSSDRLRGQESPKNRTTV